MDEDFTPLCATDDEISRWKEANALTAGNLVSSMCADCTAAFRQEMLSVDKCNKRRYGKPGRPRSVVQDSS